MSDCFFKNMQVLKLKTNLKRYKQPKQPYKTTSYKHKPNVLVFDAVSNDSFSFFFLYFFFSSPKCLEFPFHLLNLNPFF